MFDCSRFLTEQSLTEAAVQLASLADAAVIPSVTSNIGEEESVPADRTTDDTTASAEPVPATTVSGDENANSEASSPQQQLGPDETNGNHLGRSAEQPIYVSDSDFTNTDSDYVDDEDKENIYPVSAHLPRRTHRVTKKRHHGGSSQQRAELVTKLRSCHQLVLDMASDLGVEL
ncbi:MAG: hypothetical protein M1823_006075 [Watsoniomyces obsoletus]|nr:MAG: hypothetical protein M1823_006075 [Watsoniomyces obsoletus]